MCMHTCLQCFCIYICFCSKTFLFGAFIFYCVVHSETMISCLLPLMVMFFKKGGRRKWKWRPQPKYDLKAQPSSSYHFRDKEILRGLLRFYKVKELGSEIVSESELLKWSLFISTLSNASFRLISILGFVFNSVINFLGCIKQMRCNFRNWFAQVMLS